MTLSFPRVLAGLLLLLLSGCSAPPQIVGVVWQPDNEHSRPHGNWQDLGVRSLLVQWSVVDDHSFIGGCGNAVSLPPDWPRIGAEPWAGEVIMGLAGRFDEKRARSNLPELLAQAQCVAALPPALKIAGWYFPVEIDPSWLDAPQLAALLNELPRPLWVSVYDNSNIGPQALAKWLDGWLPADVRIFFQDGVGVYAREPKVAAEYFRYLQGHFGKQRLRLIAEAFRPASTDSFRAATFQELKTQLEAYSGLQVYLFEGPRYVSDDTIRQLKSYLHP
jgi:hypothetical protein